MGTQVLSCIISHSATCMHCNHATPCCNNLPATGSLLGAFAGRLRFVYVLGLLSSQNYEHLSVLDQCVKRLAQWCFEQTCSKWHNWSQNKQNLNTLVNCTQCIKLLMVRCNGNHVQKRPAFTAHVIGTIEVSPIVEGTEEDCHPVTGLCQCLPWTWPGWWWHCLLTLLRKSEWRWAANTITSSNTKQWKQ